MSRNKRHKVKKEMPDTSTSHSRQLEEHDLAYYIHDRVELMHQVFSVLKYKELKAMAPAYIRNISIDDLQELCTEELLGISSKRLCAILDGAEPPSDTESSSQSPTEQLETISLDSISSDEEILSQDDRSKKKKHKHRRHNSKSKRKKSKDSDNEKKTDKSKASRAGLTVLELLELQARARAIRAQLQQEQSKAVAEPVPNKSNQFQSSEDEVEIKEEPAEVVEISSEEEKPKIEDLPACQPVTKPTEGQSKTVTKRVKDLVITVPQQKTQKIKLNRMKATQQTADNTENNDYKDENNTNKPNQHVNVDNEQPKYKSKETSNKKDKGKKKKKKRLSHASDNDEITLQLSDTEKMDLLEDLDRKSYDNYSSDSSSGSESDVDTPKKVSQKQIDTVKIITSEKILSREERARENNKFKDDQKVEHADEVVIMENMNVCKERRNAETSIEIKNTEAVVIESEKANSNNTITDSLSAADFVILEKNRSKIENLNIQALQTDSIFIKKNVTVEQTADDTNDKNENILLKDLEPVTSQKDPDVSKSTSNLENQDVIEPLRVVDISESKPDKKDMSEGELSDRESSEVEAYDLKPEVVCISDEEGAKTKKKKKKKEKKTKKEKKSKKKDISDNSNLNVHNLSENVVRIIEAKALSSMPAKTITINRENTDNNEQDQRKSPADCSSKFLEIEAKTRTVKDLDPCQVSLDIRDETPKDIVEISDEVYELSDDSSNEDDTETKDVLSKEPTASEIEALSARIDEIEREEVITDAEIREYEAKKSDEEAISWKDRYLDSKKVKRVLNTSNILNALRKKNRQIKMRLKESKQTDLQDSQNGEEGIKEIDAPKDMEVLEGSIEQYNTLEGSTKFVDPVKYPQVNDTLKKDAKQLLKMYKKLLKYNDMNKKRDPSKKKKKKKKSKKEKEQDSVENTVNQLA